MSRCISCDKILSDFEMCRKSANTGEYVSLCNSCFHEVRDSFQVLEREDLKDVVDIVEGDIQYIHSERAMWESGHKESDFF